MRSKAMLCDAMPIHFLEENEVAWICVHKPPQHRPHILSIYSGVSFWLLWDLLGSLACPPHSRHNPSTHTEYKKQNRLIYKKKYIYYAIILNGLRAPYNYKICFVRATLYPIHLVDTTGSPTLHCFWFRKAVEICANCIYLPFCSVFSIVHSKRLQKEHTICTFFRQNQNIVIYSVFSCVFNIGSFKRPWFTGFFKTIRDTQEPRWDFPSGNFWIYAHPCAERCPNHLF